MEQYTDDERVEDLKKWWKENGTSIIVGIALGLIAIFGWQYWNSYRNAKAEQVSKAYDAFVAAAEKPDAEQARQSGQALLAEFPKSPYAALTALRLAKLALDGSDTATATQRLEWVRAGMGHRQRQTRRTQRHRPIAPGAAAVRRRPAGGRRTATGASRDRQPDGRARGIAGRSGPGRQRPDQSPNRLYCRSDGGRRQFDVAAQAG